MVTTRRPEQEGYTFVEMMIAMAIAVIIGIGIYGIFAFQRRAGDSQRLMGELQSGSRFAMDQIKKELTLAGYRAQNTVQPVKVADPEGIAFEYWDERATFEAPFTPAAAPASGYTRHTLVSFRLQGGALVRTVRRWYQGTSPSASFYMPGTASLSEADVRADFAAITDPVYRQTLATNVEAFELRYFKQNNEPWDRDPDNDLTTAPPFDEIRSVIVSLRARSAEPNPIFRNTGLGAGSGERYPSVRLQSEIRLRNADIAVNPRDRTPPAVPGSPLPDVPDDQRDLRVWDPGLCDTLELSWGANVEADLAGYTLYYGLASGSYSNRVRIATGPGAPGTRVSYTLKGLQATKACDTNPARYYFRLEAFDKSGNPSRRSVAEVSGNPSPSIAAMAGTSPTASDSTINPAPPAAPSGFAATTPSDNRIQLTWSKPLVLGLVGYRLYRSATGSGFGPVGSVAGTGNCIADERTLGPNVLGFLDTGIFLSPAILQGCTTYHYKLAAIHCDGCLPEARTNFTSASATTVDVTPPPCPVIEADAGKWKRIQLRIDNPLRSVVPDYAFTRVWQSTTGFPAYDDRGTPADPADDSVTGALIPDSSGTFTVDGTVTVNFDSVDAADPGPPALAVDTTYYFLAAGYDRCGNICSPSLDTASSRTALEQREDGFPGDPTAGAPPPAADLAVTAGCGENLTLTWTVPERTIYTDLAGFHVFRCPRQYYTMCSASEWTEITDGYLEGPPFIDTQAGGLEVGRFASYRIRTTDNYYEDYHLIGPSADDPTNDPTDNYSDTYIENLYVGGVEREERFPGPSARLAAPLSATDTEIPIESENYRAENFPSDAVTGVFTIIVGEEILACTGARVPAGTDAGAFVGCSRGTGGTQAASHARGAIVVPRPSTRPIQALCGNLGEVPPSFLHNSVEFWLRNTAAGPLTLNRLSASWQNASAYLERIDLGDGETTPVTFVWNDAANPLTVGSTGTWLTLHNAELYPLDEMIPLALSFRNADRSVDVQDNMREEQLDVSLGYRNDSTGDASCGQSMAVNVPLGPFISGTTQSLPQEGTVAAPVPGDSGLNPMNGVLVPGNQKVDVFTKVSDYDYAGIREVRLYYYIDTGKLLGAGPPLDASARYDRDQGQFDLPPYSRIDMVPVAGNQWRTPVGQGIEPSNDANVWYFIVAVDNNGNFDREPEPGSGAFQYYQQPFDLCRNVPGAPQLSWSTTSTTVSLVWTAPTLNTDGSPCADIGGYKVYRLGAGGGPVLIAELPAGALTYADTPATMDTETYTYYVTAVDTCELPGPNEGAASNWITECAGATGCTVRLQTTQQDPDFFRAGDGFSIELFSCEKINGVSGETLYVLACSGVDSSTVTLTESSDSGKFRLAAGQFTTWLSEPAGAGSLDLRVRADDTVAVQGWSATAPTGGCGSLAQCSGSLAVVSDACSSVPVPTQPTLSVSISESACNSSTPRVSLSWTGADPGPLLFYRIYRCSNQDGTTDCTPVVNGSKIYPTGLEPSLSQTTRTRTDFPQRRPDRNRIWYQVQAVSHNGCPDNSRWLTVISPPVVDNCP